MMGTYCSEAGLSKSQVRSKAEGKKYYKPIVREQNALAQTKTNRVSESLAEGFWLEAFLRISLKRFEGIIESVLTIDPALAGDEFRSEIGKTSEIFFREIRA